MQLRKKILVILLIAMLLVPEIPKVSYATTTTTVTGTGTGTPRTYQRTTGFSSYLCKNLFGGRIHI